MKSEDDPLVARFGSTIESVSRTLHQLAEIVQAKGGKSGRWPWGDDPKPDWNCEDALAHIWAQGDGSDAWRATRLAASAVLLWGVIAEPKAEMSERERVAWAVELGFIIRELEEFGLVDEGGSTLSERANLGKRFAQKSTERATLAKVQKGERRKKHIVNTVRRLLRAGLGRFKSGRINQSFLAKHYCEISDAELGERRVREIIGDAIQAGKLE